jgi:prefoldin subunit 5
VGTIGSLLGRGLKNAAETWFVGVLRAARASKLGFKVAKAKARLSKITTIKNAYVRNLQDLLERLASHDRVIRIVTESLDRLKAKLDDLMQQITRLRDEIDDLLQQAILGTDELEERQRAIDFLQRQLEPLKIDRDKLRASIATTENTLNLEKKFRQEVAEELSAPRTLKTWPPDFIIPEGNLTQQVNALQGIENTQKNAVRDLLNDEAAIARDTTSASWIDSKYADIGSEMLTLIIDLLTAFSFVEKHTCRDPSMLDEDTCLCTICPEGKQLCEPYALDIGIQPPLSRVGDELNFCVDECCDQKILKTNFSSISSIAGYFFHPCECYCPDGKTERPCYNPVQDCYFDDPSKTDEPIACAPPPPDNLPESSWFGSVTKYRWNSDICDWECKPKECPEGQIQDPDTCECVPAPSYIQPQSLLFVP